MFNLGATKALDDQSTGISPSKRQRQDTSLKADQTVPVGQGSASTFQIQTAGCSTDQTVPGTGQSPGVSVSNLASSSSAFSWHKSSNSKSEQSSSKFSHSKYSSYCRRRSRSGRHFLHNSPASLQSSASEAGKAPIATNQEAVAMEVDEPNQPSTNLRFNKEQAETSKDYFMFAARVLVGRTCQGNSRMRRPERNQEGKMTHTAVNHMTLPDIFVVFDNTQCYPEYLVQYNLG